MASPTILAPARVAPAPARALTADVQPVTFRVGLYLSGTVVLAVGVALTLVAGLGLGPADVFIGAVARHLGLGHGTASSLFIGAMVVAGMTVGARPGPGTFITVAALGPTINIAESALGGLHSGNTILDTLLGVVGLAVMCAGVALVICGDVGRGATELLVERVAARVGRPSSAVRTALEAGLLVSGVALAGPVGPVTLIVALGIGPGIAIAVRHCDRLLSTDVSVAAVRSVGRIRYSRLR